MATDTSTPKTLPDKRALLNAIADYGSAKEARNDGLTAQHFAKVCGLIDALAAQPPAVAAPEEMSPDFTDTARAALLSVLWHHQGASSPVGQPIRFALGMGAFDKLSDHQISEAKRWESIAPQPPAGQQDRGEAPTDAEVDLLLAEINRIAEDHHPGYGLPTHAPAALQSMRAQVLWFFGRWVAPATAGEDTAAQGADWQELAESEGSRAVMLVRQRRDLQRDAQRITELLADAKQEHDRCGPATRTLMVQAHLIAKAMTDKLPNIPEGAPSPAAPGNGEKS